MPYTAFTFGDPAAQGPDITDVLCDLTNGLMLGASSLLVASVNLPDATLNAPYSSSVSAFGGAAPYSFAVSAGSLPAGMSLNSSSGAITGTPTAMGVATFTVQATDSAAATATRSFSITVGVAAGGISGWIK